MSQQAMDITHRPASKHGDPDSYGWLEPVEGNAAVVHALCEQSSVIVGHDWGATATADSALVRPGVFRAGPPGQLAGRPAPASPSPAGNSTGGWRVGSEELTYSPGRRSASRPFSTRTRGPRPEQT